MMLLLTVWGAVALAVAHGDGPYVEPTGILIVETLGSYLFARRYIRDITAFRCMVKSLFVLIAVLLPFGIYENLTGTPILLQILDRFASVLPNVVMDKRLGLDRAQVTFEHPILFGVFCSSAFALAFYGTRAVAKALPALLRAGVIAIAVGSSLSAGAFVSLGLQVLLIAWDTVTRGIARRWTILLVLSACAFTVVDFLSNRTPFDVFVSYLTFNTGNSYNRILIWKYGTQELLRHPLFGIGFNEWTHPAWMSDSMDNFWLVVATRYGFPALLFLVGAFLSVCVTLGRVKDVAPEVLACRKGLLISLSGLAIAACTVHLWDASYCLFVMLLGSGLWIPTLSEITHIQGRARSSELTFSRERRAAKVTN